MRKLGILAGLLSVFLSSPAARAQDNVPVGLTSAPPSSTRGVVVMVHGMTQHAGSFAKLARYLSDKGYAVVGMDLRGHGKRFYDGGSEADDKSIDYSASASDLVQLLKDVREKNPNVPLFCLGESVGAAVTTKALASEAGLADGVILCSAGTRPRVFSPLMVVPDFFKGVVRLHHPMDVSRYVLRYSSDDHRVSQEMVEDPLDRNRMTPIEILQTGWFIRSTPHNAKFVDSRMSVLILEGQHDGIVSVHSTKRILHNLPCRDKQYAVLPNAGHVLLGTSFLKKPVLETVSTWLDSRVTRDRYTAVEPSIQADSRHN